jgi:hypothetical protein
LSVSADAHRLDVPDRLAPQHDGEQLLQLASAIVGQKPVERLSEHLVSGVAEEGLRGGVPGGYVAVAGSRDDRVGRVFDDRRQTGLEFVRAVAVGDVVDEGGEAPTRAVAKRGDRQLDREFVSVAMESRDLDSLVDQRACVGLEEAPQPLVVLRAIASRDDQVAQQRPDRDLPCPPERSLRLAVPGCDQPCSSIATYASCAASSISAMSNRLPVRSTSSVISSVARVPARPAARSLKDLGGP